MIMWFSHLRRHTQIVVAFSTLFSLAITSYFTIRLIQYQYYNSIPLNNFFPAPSDVFVYIKNPEHQWSMIKKYAFFKELCILLHGGEKTIEEHVLPQLGGEFIVGFTLDGKDSPRQFRVATRINFWKFLALPFASLFAPSDFEKISSGEKTTWKIQSAQGTLYATFNHNVALVSNEVAFLNASNLEMHPTETSEAQKSFWCVLKFENPKKVIQQARETAIRYGLDLFSPQIGAATTLSRVELALNLERQSMEVSGMCYGRFEETAPLSSPSAPTLMPSNVFFAESFSEKPAVLWENVKSWTASRSAEGLFSSAFRNILREAVELLSQDGTDNQLLPLLQNPVTIWGVEDIESEPLKPALLLVIPTREPHRVWTLLDRVVQKIKSPQMEIRDKSHTGIIIRSLGKTKIAIKELELLQPSYMIYRNYFIFSTSPAVLTKLLESAGEKAPPGTSSWQKWWSAAAFSSQRLFCDAGRLKRNLEALIPLVAEKLVDTDENRKKWRERLERQEHDYRKVDILVGQALEREKQERALEIRKHLAIFDYWRECFIESHVQKDRFQTHISIKCATRE